MDPLDANPKTAKTDLKRRLTRHADVALAVLVVSVVGMMIVPMPTWLLDILIATNISASVILLLTAIYVSDPLKIATFPTLLLVTTLYRLALNVSSTRLILLQADAGQVIQAFGDFVVSGNMVVGAVIFLILTLIQFIVIAKGSERVAEVAARFTLDAMPGKQMAIDADLRSGLIDQEEARRRRQELNRESQLYGSMDGAMKFVKGDAIAGILITIINITAGLIIGVSQMGMSWGEALQTYSILTIGDGLVSQIPALIISTSAGMIVTRVASEDEATDLGADISGQILAQPKAIGIAAVMMIILAVIPGLPTVPFLVLGGLCGVVAVGLLRSRRRRPGATAGAAWDLGWGEPSEEDEAETEGPAARTGLVEPIAVEVGPALADAIRPESPTRFSSELLPAVRARIFSRLGVPLPPVRIRSAPDLGPWGYRVRVKELLEDQAEILPDRLLASATAHQLDALGLQPEPWPHPGPHGPAAWVPEESLEVLETAGIPCFRAEEVLTAHLEGLLLRRAYEFMGIQQTRILLDALEQTHPDLVSELIPKRVPVDLLTEVLRRLTEEGVCVRNLPDILEALAQWIKQEKDPVLLTEYARMALKRQITRSFSPDGQALPVHLIDPMMEQAIQESIQHTPTGSYMALPPDLGDEILTAIRDTLGPAMETGARPVILTRMEIRRYVKKMIELELPDVPVLSYQELEPGLQIQPVGHISPTPTPAPTPAPSAPPSAPPHSTSSSAPFTPQIP